MDGDEVAIIGIGCRVPGADNIDEFWRVLVNGENHIVDIPPERWNNKHFYSENGEAGKSFVKKAGLLKGHDEWDYEIFKVSKGEAETIDPQQRLVLECSHMAIEDGGITGDQLNGTPTGVFIGGMNDDYKGLSNNDHEEETNYSATGMSSTYISARVSHVYNLQGPCMTVDTACSSSMVAIHLGCQSIRAGECTMAVCGGVNSILGPDQFIVLCKAGMVSPTGQCQTFCDTADGYARGEGCGIVILKSYKQAVQDGNKIWGLIKTGTNQDGRTALSMAAPSGDQQKELLKKMYKQYNIDPTSLQYIEAHGTGTPVGDPVETTAVGEFINSYRTYSQRNDALHESPEKHNESDKTRQFAKATESSHIRIGSVKTNIGHLESAAGVVSLIKILIMMEHGQFVPSLHIKKDMSNINKNIKLGEFGLTISVDNSEWPANEHGERHGCLNCFGFGGSNSHAIVTSKQHLRKDAKTNEDSEIKVISLSAMNKTSLSEMMQNLKRSLKTKIHDLRDISFTSVYKRDHLPYRTLLFGDSVDDIRNQIVLKHSELEQLEPAKQSNVVFFFCGVGTAWTGMCQEMMQSCEIFKSTVDILDSHLIPLTGFSVRKMFRQNADYNDPMVNHIAIFCSQVALYETWKSLGVFPDVIIGQSVGEIAAAYASGALSLEEAIEVIHKRSVALAKCTGGSMLVVGNVLVEEVEKVCTPYGVDVNIAVYNSPLSCTLSGKQNVLEKVKKVLTEMTTSSIELFFKPLDVHCAYHSSFTEPCLDEFRKKLGTLNPKSRTVTQISTVTGEVAIGSDLQTTEYWVDNIREPVKLMEAVQKSIKENKKNVFVEIGPKQVLVAHLKNIVSGNKAVAFASINKGDEITCLYSSLSKLYSAGVKISWEHIISTGNIVPIPRYVFNKTKLLHIPSKRALSLRGFESSNETHMYVRRIQSERDEFQLIIDNDQTPFVFEHLIFGRPLVPGSYYVDAAFQIGCCISHLNAYEISVSVKFLKSVMPESKHHQVMDVVESIDGSTIGCRHWLVCHKDSHVCKLTIKQRTKQEAIQRDIYQIKTRCVTHRTKDESYQCLKSMNFTYGENLQLMSQTWSSTNECLTEFNLPDSILDTRKLTHIHPSVLDGLFQTFGVLNSGSAGQTYLPLQIDSVTLNRPLQKHMFGYAKLVRTTSSGKFFNAMFLTPSGDIIAEINNFFIKRMSDIQGTNQTMAYQLIWNEGTRPSALKNPHLLRNESQSMLVIGDKQFFDNYTSVTGVKASFYEMNGEKEIRLERYSVLLLAALNRDDNTKRVSNVNVYEHCKELFLFTKALLENARKTNFKGSIFIVTDNVVTIPSSATTPSKPYGAVLWGLIRSVLHEYLNLDLHLVDVALKPENLVVLHKITQSVGSESPEILIRDGTVFYSEMVSVDTHCISSTIKTLSSQCDDMILKSSGTAALESLFFSLKDSGQTKHGNGTYCTLRVHAICLHDPLLYPLTLDEDEDECIDINGNEHSGHSVMCVEGVGHLLESNESVVGFCLPTEASNPLSVPTSCTYDLNQIAYVPGIMTASVLLYYLVCVCKTYDSSFVVIDETGTSKSLVEYMFSNCKGVSVYDKTVLDESGSYKGEIIVLLTQLSRKQIRKLIETNPGVKCIVSYEPLIPRGTRVWLERMTSHITLNVLTVEAILKGTSLVDVVPIVFKQLKNMEDETKALIEHNMEDAKPKRGEIFQLPYEIQSLRYQAIPLKVSEHELFRNNCCYINVGGLSGLGWELSAYMAEMGAGYIATIQRRSPSVDQLQKIAVVKKTTGCKIIPCVADVTNLDKLYDALKKLSFALGDAVKVKGVLHGGGVIDDCLLENMTEDNVGKVLNPKVLGTLNLHEATLNMKLDFFIMHSSVVSVTGNPGQCNYAAGNSFMDAFAYYRRSLGMCAQSINWSTLSVGMAAENNQAEKLNKKGFSVLNVDEIRRCFMFAIMSNYIQIVFGTFDWTKLKDDPLTISNPRKYATLTGGDSSSGSKKYSRTFDIAVFRKGDNATRIVMVRELVRSTIAIVFVYTNIDLSDNLVFGSLGIDSMASMHFVDYIRRATQIQIPISILYEDSTTVGSINSFILERLSSTSFVNGNEILIYERTNQLSEFLKGDVPFTQVCLLEDFKKDPFTKNIMRQVDIEIVEENMTCNLDDWRKILNHLLKIEPDLRRIFHIDDYPYSSYLLHDAEMPVEEVPFDSIGHEHVIDERHIICMDITKVIPVCAKIAISGNKTRLRLFLHGVLGDLPAVTSIFQQFSKVAIAYVGRNPLPEPNDNTLSPVDAFRKALIPRARTLQKFWSEMFSKDVEPFTLGDTMQCNLDEVFWTEIAVNVPKPLAKSVIEARNITVYSFITSAYLALLHKATEKNLIPLVTYVDMRGHVHDLCDSIISCSNGVPVLGDFRNVGSVSNYLETSAGFLNSITQNSAYPYDLILKEIHSDELKSEIGRHRIIMEDLTNMNQIMAFDKRVVNYKMFFKRHVYETSLHVLYDKQTHDISLEFGYNSSVVKEDVAKRMLLDLVQVMSAFRQKLDARVIDILKSLNCTRDHLELPIVYKHVPVESN